MSTPQSNLPVSILTRSQWNHPRGTQPLQAPRILEFLNSPALRASWESGRFRRLDEAFASLGGNEQNVLRNRFGSEGLAEIFSLSAESGSDVFWNSLLSLAGRWESHGRESAGAALRQFIVGAAASENGPPDAVLHRARSASVRVEGVLRRLAAESTDPAALAGLVVAAGGGRLISRAVAARLAVAPGAGFLTRGLGARFVSGSAAYLFEVPAYAGTVHGLNALGGRGADGSHGDFGSELLSGAVTLFALKAAGSLGSALRSRINPSPASGFALESATLLAGLQFGQRLQVEAGLRPRETGGAGWVESLATLIQFHVAGRLTGTGGARLADDRIPVRPEPRASFSFLSPAPAFAAAGRPGFFEARAPQTPSILFRVEDGAASAPAPSGPRPTVAVVGGGASGTLVAANLLKRARRPLDIQIVEGTREIGTGTAYSSEHDHHRLNVPVEKLGAFPEDPAHFLAWARERNPDVAPGQFLSRRLYGNYLQDVLADAERGGAPGVSLTRVGEVAVGLESGAPGAALRLASGRLIPADQVVLALGNAAPAHIPLEDPTFFSSPFYSQDPFFRGGAAYLNTEGPVLLIGSGLTMVDVALSLALQGRTAPIYAVSRHGRLPETHAPAAPYARPEEIADVYRSRPLRGLIRALRAEIAKAEASGSNWRAAIDALRPHTDTLWSGLSGPEQRLFLRHLARYWDVHRHRMPASSAETIGKLIGERRLIVIGGRIENLKAGGDGAEAVIRPRGGDEPLILQVGHVVNCTGPDTNYLRLQDSNPLIRSLLAGGWIHPDRFRLGLQVDARGWLLDGEGVPSAFLSTLGPPRKSTRFWETTAMPEIRKQADELSADILERLPR